MAEYPIIMKQKNDQGQYDTLYPQTLGSQIQGNIQSSQIEGDIPSSQISGNIPSSQITGQFPASQINGIYTADETLTDAVGALYNLGTSGVPNDVFNILSKAALYKTVPSTQQLGSIAEGQIVYLNENGSPVPFYVAKHDYESSLNGTGRTLVVRKDCYDNRVWDNGNVNAYASSDLDSWFNSTYKNMLDADIRSLIGTTKIRSTPGNGNWMVVTLTRAVFALSATELGQSASWFNVEGSALPIANTLKVVHLNGNANTQWTRSPNTNNTHYAGFLGSDGDVDFSNCNTSYGSRPAFTLPATFTAHTGESTGFYDVSDNLILQLPGVQIETGSYVGTGQYGSNNPNSLTFEFVPKLVFISISGNNGGQRIGIFFPWSYPNSYVNGGYKNFSSSSSVGNGYAKMDGNTLMWYSTAYDNQLNTSGATYNYIAIG